MYLNDDTYAGHIRSTFHGGVAAHQESPSVVVQLHRYLPETAASQTQRSSLAGILAHRIP